MEPSVRAAGFDGPPRSLGTAEAAKWVSPCATLSMLTTYYRTSRSLHFPFWAVCSLSGAQPEIWSVGWNPPVHRRAFRLFVAFPLQSTSFVVSPAGGRGGPGLLWPGTLGPHTAQDGSEDVDVPSRLRSGCVALQTICLRTHCRLHARIRDFFARASACIDEIPLLYLLEMPSLYLLANKDVHSLVSVA